MDTWTAVLAGLAFASGFAFLLWQLSRNEWHRLRHPGRLEMWRFLARRGKDRGAFDTSHAAQMRCALCSEAGQCRSRLAQGLDSPVDGCPNFHGGMPG